MRARKEKKARNSPLRLLLWTAFAGLIFGLIELGGIAEDVLRASRNSLHWHKASGDIVLVKIDDESLHEVGRWPWSRQSHAQLTDRLSQAGARRIYFDLSFYGETNSADDRAFAEALRRSGRVVLPVKARSGPDRGNTQDAIPLPLFADHSRLATISAQYNYQNAISRLPYAATVQNMEIPSFAADLAGVKGRRGDVFMPDYSIDPASIPTIRASDVLKGRFRAEQVRGKDIVIGWTTDVLGDTYFVPGTGLMGGVYVQIIGAETLKAGTPVHLGWVPLFLASLAIAAWALSRRSSALQNSVILGGVTALVFGPALVEAHLIYVDVTPALFVVLTTGVALLWRRTRQRGMVNAVSGLPNLNALRLNREGREQALIAARIVNYAEIAATLPPESERQLVEQIVSRLKIGAPERVLFHGDDGIFAWFEEPRLPFAHHLEALSSLFRNPARVAGRAIDLAISFGVEIGSGRSTGNRFSSALVAADEAAHDGLKWKYHDPETLQDASWKLSMLSQLDDAVDKGEVWVAYQPKLDLQSRRIVGAEALARWTHPAKGPIAASEFIAAAEQHDRIGKLTDFVLEQAIAAAAALNRRDPGFNMAVNLSARLLNDQSFLLRVSAMLARHHVPAHLLTLELTETAALASSGGAFEMLSALRELGIGISIDDYGTGMSTLEYLKKIPANEIKVDQSFVKSMCDNRSDRVMVQSTIGLAHSLGRKVVAEGVETRDILEALTEMGCDVAQGFSIGRPMSLESLSKRLSGSRSRNVA